VINIGPTGVLSCNINRNANTNPNTNLTLTLTLILTLHLTVTVSLTQNVTKMSTILAIYKNVTAPPFEWNVEIHLSAKPKDRPAWAGPVFRLGQ